MGLWIRNRASGVEFEEALHALRGGLRLSFTALPDVAQPPNIHAGDEVAVVTEVKRPQVSGMKARSTGAHILRNKISILWPLSEPRNNRSPRPLQP